MSTINDFLKTHVETATGINGQQGGACNKGSQSAGCGCSASVPKQDGGAKKKATGGHINTGKKIKVNGQEYTLFKGPRGGKYIRKNGKYIAV
jgi:hypothetical protein